MARAKHVDVQTFAPGPRDAAIAEVWGNIDRLLVFANLNKDERTEDARKVHRVLTLISEAADRWYDGDRQPVTFKLPGAWPPGAVVGVRNLVAIIRQGNPRLYVRRCPECRQWCLTKNKKQKRRCHREECFRAANSRRTGSWQRDRLEDQKKALTQARASSRTR